MPTLIYTPQVRVFIKTLDGKVIDVSEDLVNGQLVRRSDGVSTFNFSLQNARRKYDNVFTPNDRIIVQMKRFVWLRVFSGYLNSVPIFSVWPRVVPLSASCSLKRLQYWWWDPALPASEQLVRSSLLGAAALVATPPPGGPGKENTHTQADGGIKNVLLALLDHVAGWPNDKVHISAIPPDWFGWAAKVQAEMLESTAQSRAAVASLQAQVGANGTLGGTPVGGNVNGIIKPGTSYGGSTFDDKQCQRIEQVWNALVGQQATRDEGIITFMVCMQESMFRMYSNTKIPESRGFSPEASGSDGYSVGLYQQQPSPYFHGDWGTVAQCMDPKYSTERFLRELRNRVGSHISSQPKTVSAQRVQGSAYPQAYAQWETPATALVTTLMTASSGPDAQVAGSTAQGRATTAGRTGQITGAQLAQRGVDLVRKDRPGPTEGGAVVSSNIPYRLGNDSPPESPAAQIQALDCSSFVAWCYFQASGGGRSPRTSQDQAKWCRDRGNGLKTPASDGLRILGALMFNGGADAHHVGISLGDGMHTVEASHTGSNVHVITNTQWDAYGLPPGVNYNGMQNTSIDFGGGGSGSDAGQTGAGITGPALDAIQQSDSPANSTDPIDELFNGVASSIYGAEGEETAALVFTGGLAVANDQPLLPYLKNLVNSSMRSFSSGPNGDFISWFPDYYGLWGTAGVMKIAPIELLDFTVDWSDDNLVTHQFIRRSSYTTFDLTGGQLGNGELLSELNSSVVSIEQPAVMQALFGLDTTDEATARFTDFIFRRFGVRPDMQVAPGVTGDKGAFFLALYLFMQRWAYQYNADVPITFMPELWPGMLLQIPDFSFQAYVTTVTHTFDFGEGGGFQTTANIASPARLDDENASLLGLPRAAGAGTKKHVGPVDFKKAAAAGAAVGAAAGGVAAGAAGH